MSVGQSIRSKILDWVVARLQTELVSNPGGFYPAPVMAVRRGYLSPPDIDSSPTLCVNADEETPYEDSSRGGRKAGGGPAAGVQDRVMRMSVQCWLTRDGDTSDEYMHQLATGIESAILQQDGSGRRMGGYAINTWWIRSTVMQAEQTAPQQWLSVEFRVYFRTAYGRPDIQV